MRYTTTDELEHFSFAEAYIADVQLAGGFFHMTLSNVTILPENSCNRDIREMRANDLVLKIEEPVIRSLVREGYKVYDANGVLMKNCADEVIDQAIRIHADMIVTHHPLIFRALKQINDEQFISRRIVRMIQADISYFAMHTNFDIAPGCMAD